MGVGVQRGFHSAPSLTVTDWGSMNGSTGADWGSGDSVKGSSDVREDVVGCTGPVLPEPSRAADGVIKAVLKGASTG